jgi:hypothetical protein
MPSAVAWLAMLVVLALPLVCEVDAAEWGTIVPGDSTIETVRARYGLPTTRRNEKVDGYDTTTWVYEGPGAPRGLRRLTVSFGLLKPAGFRPEVVRVFRLEPAPGVFTRNIIRSAWGPPSATGQEGGWPAILYDQGLIVVFERDGEQVREMIFTLPQKPR